jgi:hypothetical protein
MSRMKDAVKGLRSISFVLIGTILLTGVIRAQVRSAAASWLENLSFTATGTANWVENLSRTSAEPNRRDAGTYEFSVAANHHQQLAPSWMLHAGADAWWFTVPDYKLADRVVLGPRAGLQKKFGLGPLAPVVQFDAAFTYKASRLDFDRGWTTALSLRLAKRFTPAFKAGLTGAWTEHNARSAVFDFDQHSLSVDTTWDINEQWSVSASAGRLNGNIVANAAWAVWSQAISGGFGPQVFNYYTSRPWQVTGLYGPGWVSYNVEAKADLWSLAATYALSDRTTAELRYGSVFVVNQIGIRYPTDSWGLSVTHRF